MQFLHHLTAIKPELISQAWLEVWATIDIEDDPLTLVIQNIGTGPRGLPALSVWQYRLKNEECYDRLRRDPEMSFELQVEEGKVTQCHPYYYYSAVLCIEHNAILCKDTGETNQQIVQELTEMAVIWSRTLEELGYLQKFR